METYTTAEAARLTGTTVRALRKRIERGTLRAARGGGGWRIPRSELERAGLHISPPAEATELVAELAETIRRQERELAALRALPAKVEQHRHTLAALHGERQAAELRAAQSDAEAQALRAEVAQIAAAGPIRALRLRRKLRVRPSEAA
jgi:excisionase family DNA binding protein